MAFSVRWLVLFSLFHAAFPRAFGQPGFSGDSAGLAQMAAYIQTATQPEREALTRALVPALRDYYAVFDSTFARVCFSRHQKFRRNYYFEVKPSRTNETILYLWHTTPEELAAYTGNARYFSGGYKELAAGHHLRAGTILYRIKFVRPGHQLGSGYDMFAHVEGHWKLFLRPWQALDKP